MPLIVDGQYPNYTISDGHCLCSYFGDINKMTALFEMIRDVLTHKSVKKVLVKKYWSTYSKSDAVIKVGIEELHSFILSDRLEEDLSYSIVDYSKFEYGL